MADDNTLRSNRSDDPYRRSAGPAGAQPRGSDPLAELARLIGQTDPFTEFRQNDARGAAPQPAAAAPPTAPDWRRNAMPGYDTARGQPAVADPRVPPGNSGYQRRDPYQMASGGELPAEGEADDAQAYQHQAYQHDAPHDQSETHHDDPRYAGAGPDGHESEAYHDEGAAMGPHDDEMYDDAPPSRRRGGALTAVTIIVCAVLGSGGAYAYRSYSTRAQSMPAPPVIIAEKTPTKVVPATDPQSSKTIQDRIRDQGPNERVVSREEQPVELKNLTTVAPSRPGLPGSGAPSLAQASAPALLPPVASSPAVGEPKRVRTVTIRPDGADLSGRPVGSLGPSTASVPAAPARSAAPPAARNGGPISLDPQTPASAPPPAARERPAAAAVPPPTRLASAPTDGAAAGGYLVQISSQKSDTEAQASIRSLQAKYPHLLNGQQPTVRRADLGAKGVFYRAVVGPFASSGEANSLCSGLKAAGGQCLVQKN